MQQLKYNFKQSVLSTTATPILKETVKSEILDIWETECKRDR